MKKSFVPFSAFRSFSFLDQDSDRHSGINIDRRKKHPDARLWRRSIKAWRRRINPVTVAVFIIPVSTPVIIAAMSTLAVAVMPTLAVAIMPLPPVFVMAVVILLSPAVTIIISVGWRHVYAADHRGYGKPEQNLARYGSQTPSTRCFHTITPFLDGFQCLFGCKLHGRTAPFISPYSSVFS